MTGTELIRKIKSECYKNGRKADHQILGRYQEIAGSFSSGYFIRLAGSSVNETPMLSVRAEGADAPQAYIWTFGDYFYLKTPFEIASTESVVKLRKLADDYFYC